jgi:pimeloyl-ACP methyl ester carboxylesterase
MMDTLRRSVRQMLKSWYIGFFQIPVLADWVLRINDYSATRRMLASSGKAGTFSPENMAEYKLAWAQPGALSAMINWYRAAFRERSKLNTNVRVQVPTLVLWGKRDVALSAEMAQESIELCDNGRLVTFENATHWVQHDEAEEVNRQLIEFFDGK